MTTDPNDELAAYTQPTPEQSERAAHLVAATRITYPWAEHIDYSLAAYTAIHGKRTLAEIRAAWPTQKAP